MLRRLTSSLRVRFSDSKEVVEKQRNPSVMIEAVKQIAVENNKLAVRLRDEGKIAEARKVLMDNAFYCDENWKKFGSKKLHQMGADNWSDSKNLEKDKWRLQRKRMLKHQHSSGSGSAW